MQLTTKYSGVIQEITNLARSKNSEIGNYIEHYLSLGYYRVRVRNGGLNISFEKAEDFDATGKLTDEQIQEVANSFAKL